MTPTQKAVKYMREQGYLCEVVERWNSFAKIRQDLFGFIDIVCVKDKDTVAVQATSKSNTSARVKKIMDHPNYHAVASGWRIAVMGFEKGKTAPVIEWLS